MHIQSSPPLSRIHRADFDTRSKVVSPSLISEHTYCNEADEEMPFESFTQTTELSTGTESCFTLGGTFEFGQSYQFEATVNVPTLGSATGSTSTEWKLTVSSDYRTCWTTTKDTTTTLTYPSVAMSAHQRAKFVFSRERTPAKLHPPLVMHIYVRCACAQVQRFLP